MVSAEHLRQNVDMSCSVPMVSVTRCGCSVLIGLVVGFAGRPAGVVVVEVLAERTALGHAAAVVASRRGLAAVAGALLLRARHARVIRVAPVLEPRRSSRRAFRRRCRG